MKPYVWDEDKNDWLLTERGVSFEMVLDEIETGRFRIEENVSANHLGQKVFLVGFCDPSPPGKTLVHVVPFIEHDECIELKTIFFDVYWQKRFGESL